MIESFVDLTYRGLSLGRRIRLSHVRPRAGYLELPAPMPVGTQIAIATEEGIAFDATVTAVAEAITGSDRTPGMTVTPALTGERAAAWWAARVTPGDDEPAPRAVERSGPVPAMERSGPVSAAERGGPSPAVERSGPVPSTERSGATRVERSGPVPAMERSGPVPSTERSGATRVERSGPVPAMERSGPVPAAERSGATRVERSGPVPAMERSGPVPATERSGATRVERSGAIPVVERSGPVTVHPRTHSSPIPVVATASDAGAPSENGAGPAARPAIPARSEDVHAARTVVMPVVDLQAMAAASGAGDEETEADATPPMPPGGHAGGDDGEHTVIDDGQRTILMDAVDPALLDLSPGELREAGAGPAEAGDDSDDPGEVTRPGPAAPGGAGARRGRRNRKSAP